MTPIPENTMPLSERLRPQTFGDLTLPAREIDRFQRMSDTKNLMNMLFYGSPGMGKTSAARIFLRSTDPMDTLRMDGSSQTSVHDVRNVIDRFSSTMSWTGGLKLCFIDEADFLSQSAQASLRGIIENRANCRFIMAVNDLSKIMPAIRSRMICIRFNISKADRPGILKRIENRLVVRLTELGVPFDRERLNAIVATFFPDFRQIVSRLEYEFVLEGRGVPFGTADLEAGS
jgi:replication factor C small subunit